MSRSNVRTALARLFVGLLAIAFAAIACRENEPGLDPRTPANSPIPTKLDRPDEPRTSPLEVPKLRRSSSDGGARE